MIDKYKKVEKSEILQSIQALGVSSDIAEKICTFVETKIDLAQIETLKTFSNDETFLQGVEELKEVLTVLQQFQTTFTKSFAFEIDFQIVRGLDYYTGTVFEFTLQNDPAL
ncbi:MAG: ATP phosphoribosyltransferase regulatory subunit [Patescibacteria group bacterium]|nr:ATP phosphoribosyltransferase regulatory subunit [Patescibacteria group bacterium]